MKKRIQALKKRFLTVVKNLKLDLAALQIGLEMGVISLRVKLLVIVTLAYAFSPIDLIPDFIPVLGLLDDLIILPILIALAVKLIPDETMATCRAMAKSRPTSQKKNWLAGFLIILIWILVGSWMYFKFINTDYR